MDATRHDATAPTGSDEVHVIGGGLGGLAAAAIVAQSGRSVVVHEQRGRLGGRATTDERGGYRFNQGPHALYLGGEAVTVLRRLGITPSGTTPATKGALMARDGATHLAPGGPGSLARTNLLGLRDKIELGRLLARLAKLEPAASADQTAQQWIDNLTDRERVAEVLHSLVRLTTYVNAPDQLSAEVAVLQVQLALGSGVIYLDRGWVQLVEALAAGVANAGGTVMQDDTTTEIPDAAAIIVAVGGPAATSALLGQPLACGPESSASTLDLALCAPALHRFVIGVDEPIYLSDHGRPDGMTPPDRASVSLAHYLAPEDAPDRDKLRAFARYAGIAPDQVLDERYLHRMTTVSAIATASGGGLAGRTPVVASDRPGVFVVGDWVGGSGHLADAVLASASAAARAAIAHLERRPVAR